MKFTKYIIGFGLLAVAFGAQAQFTPRPQVGFGVGTTNAASTLSTAIVSAYSANGGTPRVTYINAMSDGATNKIKFYKVTAQASANYTNTTTSLPVTSTNGFGVNDIIIIRHLATDQYEKRTVTTFVSSTNLVTTAAPLETVAIGDIIYRATSTGAGVIAWGASTNSITTSAGIYYGQAGLPLLVEIEGSTVATLNVVAGDFVK